ncbi:hypothetical protein BDY21DRAFT_363814 [Lineolata rhizophorae]|uniref:Transcriptional regulator n=1 Tax=Lineolata rhizophorae TaxID=578093 RepID=A0A6A6P1C7_9PEZI|nr:hypothetical protein BDY21DRAFT_363814 [Lineolata rhizophorae]
MSGSEASADRSSPTGALAPDAMIEGALRGAVAKLFAESRFEDLTVKRVRRTVEEELQLGTDFLKTDKNWGQKSKDVIADEVSAQESKKEGEKDESPPPAPPKSKSKTAPAVKKRKEPQSEQPAKRTMKRASPQSEQQTAPKRRKVSLESELGLNVSEDEEKESAQADGAKENEANEEEVVKKPKAKAKPRLPAKKGQRGRPKKKAVSADKEEEEAEEAEKDKEINLDNGDGSDAVADVGKEYKQGETSHLEKEASPTKATVNETKDDDSSSLSSVIDETPPPKRRKKKEKPDAKLAGKQTKKRASKAKDETNVDPNDAEIKRLQGWLVKCGIRKMWWRELQPYDTPRAKINHLKAMLKDAGMDGRYSIEKARQIKERRELAADLEAVQEGNKRWGHSESEEEDPGKPKRRLARGLKELAFLNDDDGEESD